ncbi:MAG TPA: EamA family transporter [Steroidobacteraceae bacterium]|nr:EamA family transporter [Steroidobacteraceae bacterium]
MRLSAFSFLCGGVLLNALAQLGLKAATDTTGPLFGAQTPVLRRALELLTVPWLWAALACYGLSVVVWLVGLSRVPVSQAYPLLSLGYVINVGLAWWLLGEVPNVQRVAGIAVIVFGVVLVARS